MSKSEVVALSLIREAEVSTLSAEKEMQFVQVLNNVTLVDARKFLRWNICLTTTRRCLRLRSQ